MAKTFESGCSQIIGFKDLKVTRNSSIKCYAQFAQTNVWSMDLVNTFLFIPENTNFCILCVILLGTS